MENEIVLMDPEAGRSLTLKPAGFSELGVREREDLERWILDNPDTLGDQLLLITSEYDRFDKSDKRLDLLALDGEGKLVVIELKRDAARSLADLQAIRYASFCSTMTFEQVVTLYAEFAKLDKETARQKIRDFVQDQNFSAIDNRPRIILAAGGFDDQELTSCVLWLRSFGVDISCVEITPYRMTDENRLIMVPRVIIPLPEARDYVVGIETKEAGQSPPAVTSQFYRERNQQILDHFQKLTPGKGPRTAWTGSYMQIPTGHAAVHFEWIFRGRGRTKTLNVAVHFETGSKEWNQRLCDALGENKTALGQILGEPLHVNREWGAKWASVYIEHPCEPWGEEIAQWAAQKMSQLIQAAQPLLDEYYSKNRVQ